MKPLKSDIIECVEMIWGSILSLDISPSEKSTEPNCQGFARVTVHVTGQWNAVILLALEKELIPAISSAFFPPVSSEDDPEDNGKEALAELGNMVGGNIKSLMPEPSQLSLPLVISEEEVLPFSETQKLEQVGFQCNNCLVTVSIYEFENAQV